MRALVLLAVIVGLAAPGTARGAVTLAQGPPGVGAIHLLATQDPATDDLRIVESVDGTDVPLEGTPTATGAEAQPSWTCRTPRTFAAVAGAERSSPLVVTTPACADRLRIASAHRVGRGGNLRVTLIDRWELGDFAADVCARPPHAARRCERIAFGPGDYVRHAVFRATQAGIWRVKVVDPWRSVSLPAIRVTRQGRGGKPVVLFTGDSMMLAPQQVLRRRLGTRATSVDDVYVGSGISHPLVIDWTKLPRDQVRAYRPDATVTTLGMDDTGDLPAPGGAIRCCDDDFISAYAQRVRAMMSTYLRGGRGAVVWLNVPLARDPRRWPSANAIDAAVAIAAEGLDRVRIVDQRALLTPDGYEADRTIDGTRVRLRTDDGIHLTKVAAGLVARPVLSALGEELGVVASR